MSSRISVSIENAGTVNNADTQYITNYYTSDGSLQSQTVTTVTGQPPGGSSGIQVNALMPDSDEPPSATARPPEQNASVAAHNRVADLPMPIQESVAPEQDGQQAQPAPPQPRAPEESMDYISLGRERDRPL